MELADGVGNPNDECQNPKEARIPNDETASRQQEHVRASSFGFPSSFDICHPDFYTPRTLRADLKSRGALPADEMIQLALKLTAALAHLHAQGLVHRDVKPSNILFIGGEPKLADAGLVADVDDARSLVGTAGYIAPEGPGTPQADLFALGKVLYEAAFGFWIFHRVRQLHDVIEKPGVVVAADMEDVHLALAGVGERLEFFKALKLALVGPVVVEGFSIDDFHRPKGAEDAAGQPHLAVAAHSDRAEQFVFRNRRRDAGLAR